jgi:hypothetical protein
MRMKLFAITVISAVLGSTAVAGEPSFVSDGKVSVCTTANFLDRHARGTRRVIRSVTAPCSPRRSS